MYLEWEAGHYFTCDPTMALALWSLDVALGIIALLITSLLITQTLWRTPVPKGLRLPPGPRGKFLVGNVADMPKHQEWETFAQWAKDYGSLVYIKIFGQPMVSVSSLEVAHDLFETRSSIYSDRGDFPMMVDLMGFDWTFVLMHYGERWRRHRKVFQSHFHTLTVSAWLDIQVKHTRDILQRFPESPDKYADHFRHLAGATILEIVYGIKVRATNDPYIDMAETMMKAAAEAGIVGAFLVDTLPILKHVPEWMPGAGFKRKARAWRVSITQSCEAPFIAVKKALQSGTAQPSFTASLLEDLRNQAASDAHSDAEEVIRNTAAVAYAAGSDTVVSALEDFMLAMVLYPEVQRKAQAEIDSVIGTERLLDFEDRKDLPYTNALCKEVLRWHPVVPLGVPHRVMQDDIYGDYFIPGGTIVFGNSWTILHDEKIYGPETREFRPERFLVPGVKYPDAAFGFGRRICPGRHMADNTIFIAAASILQVFNISHAKDDLGNEIPVKAAFTSGFFSRPEPFRCSVKPRSAQAAALVTENHDE